jgi:hypothetical protein
MTEDEFEGLYRFWLDQNDLTTENAENTEGDKRDQYRTILLDLIL